MTTEKDRLEHKGDGSEAQDVLIPISLPLPLDVVATLMNLIGAAYPDASIVQEPAHYDKRLVMRVPASQRFTPKKVGKRAVAAARVEAELDAPDLLAWDDEGIGLSTPESIALPLAQSCRSLFDEQPLAANYVEMTVLDRDDPAKTYLVTVCRSKGQTPHALRMKAEKERDEAIAALEAASL